MLGDYSCAVVYGEDCRHQRKLLCFIDVNETVMTAASATNTIDDLPSEMICKFTKDFLYSCLSYIEKTDVTDLRIKRVHLTVKSENESQQTTNSEISKDNGTSLDLGSSVLPISEHTAKISVTEVKCLSAASRGKGLATAREINLTPIENILPLEGSALYKPRESNLQSREMTVSMLAERSPTDNALRDKENEEALHDDIVNYYGHTGVGSVFSSSAHNLTQNDVTVRLACTLDHDYSRHNGDDSEVIQNDFGLPSQESSSNMSTEGQTVCPGSYIFQTAAALEELTGDDIEQIDEEIIPQAKVSFNSVDQERRKRNVVSKTNVRCSVCRKIMKMRALAKHTCTAGHRRMVKTPRKKTKKVRERKLKKKDQIKKECPVCAIVIQSSSMDSHMRIHTGERPYQCEICGHKFIKAAYLRSHLSVHSGEKRFQCSDCGNFFRQKRGLEQHMMVHTDERPYTCKVCGKKFRNTDKLNRHSRVHTGEKPYKCEVCGLGFTQKNNMIEHSKKHVGDRDGHSLYRRCDICGMILRNKNTSEIHKRRHAGEKPYACRFCDKSFNSYVGHYQHLKIHVQVEEAFQCFNCGWNFFSAKGLNLHLQNCYNGV